MKRKCWSSRALWSLVVTVLVLFAYLLPAYFRSVGEFDTSSVLLSMKTSLLTSTLFWWQLGRFLLVLAACHFLFFYLLAEVASILYRGRKQVVLTILLWGVGLLFLQTVNSGFFPHSILAFELAFGLMMPIVAALLLLMLLIIGTAHCWWRGYRRWRWWVAVPSLVLVCGWAGYAGWRWSQVGPQGPLPADKPNIVMIGVDALRPDALAYMHAYDPDYKSPMPFLDEQLAHSVVFTQAYTTIARTYPSWMAMLTGLDPLHSGVRFNLQDDYGWWRGKVRTLPQYLKQRGYQTVWGIDETSFANFGHRHGFDKVIEPEPGAAFFLVNATMSDIPLVSILSNSRFGNLLFPMLSGNRSVGFAYYPSTFSDRLDDFIRHSDRSKPLFMAVHFELAHYPTIWADDHTPTSIADIYNHYNVGVVYYRYDLSRASQQVAELMAALKKDGRLNNAIVIFLSDHGNGFYTGDMGKDRFGSMVYMGDHSTGHGTDITDLAQQHALLAIRGFGQYSLEPGYRDNLVSLMDVAPTLLWTLGITPNESLQGVPLDVLGTAPKHRRVVYFESGLYFPGLGSGDLNLAAHLAEEAKSYRIRRDGRLVLRNDMLAQWYERKNRAAYDGRYLLGEVWDHKDTMLTVGLISRKTGKRYIMDDKTLRMPGVAELGYDFCQYYSKNDPYFTKPAFCNAIVVKNE